MVWLILVIVYLIIGLGVFAWCIHSNDLLNPQKLSGKGILLNPELSLFWPIGLFIEIKRRRAVSQTADKHID